MGKKIKEFDAYINNSADFAKPILTHFRELVHNVCPDAEEKLKWGMPYFHYKDALMCGMASFKNHCAITFWKAGLFKNSAELVEKAKTEEAMGHLGKIQGLKDLPKDTVLARYIKEAMKFNEKRIKLPATKKTASVPEIPDYFIKTLRKNKAAFSTFEKFSNANKKEYIVWVTEAKTEETRLKRLNTAIEWMSEGKVRNWKYVKNR
jgi:uncharacterized protein YdeI (YjbR/CyaY-like superfamily)